MNNYTFSQLKKNCKKPAGGFKQLKLAILGNCATQLLAEAVRGYAWEQGISLQILDTDYNQLEAQTRDQNSELFRFQPDYILIQWCSEKLQTEFYELSQEKRPGFAAAAIGKLQSCWQRIAERTQAPILQFDFVEADDGVFGNFGIKTPESFSFQIRKLNALFAEAAAENKQVFPIALAALSNRIGRNNFFDPKFYYLAKMPIKVDFLPDTAKLVMDTITALAGRFHKCAVLDLDNTLWGGVIGDDGMEGIRIGELGDGPIYSDIQRYFKELSRRGILLAVCSKNEQETALKPFREHPEMVLRETDFAMFTANWEDKAGNIRKIQKTLNIGMDSIVFIDDNPFERRAVKSLIPELMVPELPEEPEKYLQFLKEENLFETISFSGEDTKRTAQYRAEAQRLEAVAEFASYDEYLKSLEMVAEAKPFDRFHYGRIAQLTQRSNQFNLRTIRYTEEEISRIAQNDNFLTLYFTLKDKFGDHGLISVVILEKQQETLFINTLLMSCRVLKRGMEEFIINKIIRTAASAGFATVTGEYLPTPKNAMVAQLFSKHGFSDIGEGKFLAETKSYQYQNNFIKEL